MASSTCILLILQDKIFLTGILKEPSAKGNNSPMYSSLSTRNLLKWLLVLLFLIFIACIYFFDLLQYLSFEQLKTHQDQLKALQINNPAFFMLIYFFLYILVTGLSLPGAAVMTLAGGFVFGFVTGTILVSFASTIGATLAFLFSRFLFRDWVQKHFHNQLKAINEGIQKEGSFYLFSLRLIPLFPFFVINLVMGMTPLKTWKFFFVSQVGMLPGTMAYVNAGTQLGRIDSLSGILSWPLLLSFAILGLLPLAAKKTIHFLRMRQSSKGSDYAKKI